MNVTFREVQNLDIPQICRLPQNEDELFFMFPRATFPLQAAELESAISQRQNSTVALINNSVAGFANFYQWEKLGRCSIGNVIVAQDYRRKGVAAQLIQHMVEVAFSAHQAQEVSVSCFCTNVAGLLLYPKLGFQPYAIEERQSKNGLPLALIHMRLLRSK